MVLYRPFMPLIASHRTCSLAAAPWLPIPIAALAGDLLCAQHACVVHTGLLLHAHRFEERTRGMRGVYKRGGKSVRVSCRISKN